MWLVDLGLIIVPFLHVMIILFIYCSSMFLAAVTLLFHVHVICVYLQLYLNLYELIFPAVYYPGTSNFSRNAAQFSVNCFDFHSCFGFGNLNLAFLSFSQTTSWMHGPAFLFLSISWLINLHFWWFDFNFLLFLYLYESSSLTWYFWIWVD